MGGKSRNVSRITYAFLVALVFLMAISVYFLSFGPMYWACTNPKHEIVGPQGKALVTIYYPVIWLYQNGPSPIRHTIGSYLELFE